MADTKAQSPSGADAEKKKSRGPPALVRVYLVLYNLLSAVLWSGVLAVTVNHVFVAKQPVATLYGAVGELLTITQSLALLEVVHSLIGFVRSPFVTAAIQVASRLLLVWGITNPVEASRLHWGYAMMVMSWATVEIPRYLYYVVNLIAPDSIPSALTFLRYSLFMVLYPSGISGELSCIWQALDTIKATNMWSLAMPNAYNFTFSWYAACLVILALYVPGSPVMYGHMLHQRRKVLGGAGADKDKKKTH